MIVFAQGDHKHRLQPGELAPFRIMGSQFSAFGTKKGLQERKEQRFEGKTLERDRKTAEFIRLHIA